MRHLLKAATIASLYFALFAFIPLINMAYTEHGEAQAVPGEFLVGFEEITEDAIALIEKGDFEVVRRMDQIRVLLVKGKDGVSLQAFIQTLARQPLVRYVEPNYIVRLPPLKVTQIIEATKVDVELVPSDPWWSTDPIYGSGQWNMRVIDVDRAWDIDMGSHDVIVAVVDTGLRKTHHDLDANYMSGGHDWVNGDDDPDDDHGHGTHVAGIIAAETNNGYGVAGLAQVSIVAEKVINSKGQGTVASLALGIMHAADLGADVINMSLGTYRYSETLMEAVNYAHAKGCVLVAAAGNDGDDTPFYPAAFDSVIAVASTYGEPDDCRAPYSNYGSWVTISAPGGFDVYSVLSTYYLSDDYFAYMQGTSQATAHVSGLAALYRSTYPAATNMEVGNALEEAVDDKGEPGWDELYGYGRINAYLALTGPQIASVGGEAEIVSLDRSRIAAPWTGLAVLVSLGFITLLIVRRIKALTLLCR